MASQESVPKSAPPQQSGYWQFWLGLLPPLYILSPLSLLALRYFSLLPQPARWLIGFYALSQQIPALFAPEPLLASGLALIRTLLLTGLICLGAWLGRRPLPFRWLGLGLSAVYLTALGAGAWEERDFLISRLNHPYITTVTLGLMGAVGIWWAAFSSGKWTGRLPVAILAGITLLLSGSRGPLLAAFIGLTIGLLASRRRQIVALVGGGLIVLFGLAAYGMQSGWTPLTRLMQLDVAGRQVVWHNVLSVIQSEPLSGVGPYRLGTRLASPQSCQAFADATREWNCPEWFDRLGQPWLIAHNLTLQQWAESGPLGTAGLFLLLGAVLVAAWKRRDPFGLAVTGGLLVANLNDNTLLIPGPFIGELFWIVAGVQLQALTSRAVVGTSGLAGALLLFLFSTPVIALMRPAQLGSEPQLVAFYAPPTASAGAKDYRVFALLRLPAGRYLVNLESCSPSCRTIVGRPLVSDGQKAVPVEWQQLQLMPLKQQKLELVIFPASGTALGPVATHRWQVESK